MLIVIIEEHNEAFYIIQKFTQFDKYTLLHVDEHHDLGTAILSKSNLKRKQIRDITYNDLRISDYIIPLAVTGKVDRLIWINNKVERINCIKTIKETVGKEHLIYSLCDELNFGNILTINSINLTIDNSTQIFNDIGRCLLSIDLDYFDSNDYNGETYFIEVTEKYYDDFFSNKYNLLKLHQGAKVKAINENGKFFIKVNELDGGYRENTITRKQIKNKISKLCEILVDKKINPELIILCKSKRSGYTNDINYDFIFSNVLKGMNKIFVDRKIMNIKDIVYD